jgi:beta-phosphoglucomutase
MTKKQYRAILFDFDGVLAKTMEDNLRAWQAALGEFGVVIQPEEYLALEGMKLSDVAKKLCVEHEVKLDDYEAVVKSKEKHYANKHAFEFYPGVEDLLSELHLAGVPIALVTAALYPRIEKTVPGGFLRMFEVVISGEKTARGKPNPDPYLAAANALRLSGEECVVVENSPLGIESAKSAGAYCIAICSTLSKSKLTGADEIVETFSELNNSPTIKQLLSKNGTP